MAFQTVTCLVVYRASIGGCEGDGRPVTWPVQHLGDFETQRDADQALADAGLTRSSYGNWTGYYQWGSVSRILIEQISG